MRYVETPPVPHDAVGGVRRVFVERLDEINGEIQEVRTFSSPAVSFLSQSRGEGSECSAWMDPLLTP